MSLVKSKMSKITQSGTRNSSPKSRFGVIQYVYQRPYENNQNAFRKCLLRDRLRSARNLYRKDLKGHFGCVNAIEFSQNGGEWITSGGDDRRVLLWNVEKAIQSCGEPIAMDGAHNSNIFCLSFNNDASKIYSGGNDQQVLVHDAHTGKLANVFLHEDAVYGLSVDPISDHIFASACDDGQVLVYDTRAPPSEDPFCLASYTSPMHAVMYNPVEPRLLVTANSKEGASLWDIRKPRTCVVRYGGNTFRQSCMSVRFSSQGDRLIALRRRLPPVMYNIESQVPVYQFDHTGYYNSCTMKSCCFAGDNDQYLISGSDDFNLYMWRIPEKDVDVPWVGEAQLVLRGHRSIVNQVRFNKNNHIILSSGVEKVIKMWSPFRLPRGEGDLGREKRRSERSVYTHEEYINLVLRSGEMMTHDYTTQSMDEDPRMMAFFDSLVQRELEGLSSEDSIGMDSDVLLDSISRPARVPELTVQRSDSEDSEAGLSSTVPSSTYSPFTLAFANVLANQEQLQNREGTGNEDGHHILDLDAHNSDPQNASGDTSVLEYTAALPCLPGQQSSMPRMSITSLIAKRRKKYISDAHKILEEKNKLKEKKKTSSRSKNSKKVQVILVPYASQQSSSDTDSDVDKRKNKANRKRRKSNAHSSSSSSSSNSSSSDEKSKSDTCSSLSVSSSSEDEKKRRDDILNAINKARQSKVEEMQKIKRLRARARHCDDSSDGESFHDSVRTCESRTDVAECSGVPVALRGRSSLNSTSTAGSSSQTDSVTNGHSSSSAKFTSSNGGENTGNDKMSTVRATTSTGATSDSVVTGVSDRCNNSTCAKPVKVNCISENEHGDGAVNTLQPNGDSARNNKTAFSSMTVNSSDGADSPGHSGDNGLTTVSQSHMEFKRFKNNIERKRRKYRKRGSDSD